MPSKVIFDKDTIIDETQDRVVHNWLRYFSEDSI